MYDVDKRVVLRLSLFQLVDPRPQLLLHLDPLSESEAQLLVLECQSSLLELLQV